MAKLLLIWIVLLFSSKGVDTTGVTLTIDGSQQSSSTIVCGSETIFKCEFDVALTIRMEWFIDSALAGYCSSTTCDRYTDTSSRYFFTKNNSNTDFYLSINPVNYTDSLTIYCQDQNVIDSNSITSIVEARLVKSSLTETTNVASGDLNIVATTNCVSKPNSVSIKLQYKQGSDAYKDLIDSSNNAYKDFITSTTSTCTDAENPNCGGTATSKKVFTINTPTNSNGQSYDVRLVYTDSGGSITRDIGSFEIDINETTSTTTTTFTSTITPTTQTSSIAVTPTAPPSATATSTVTTATTRLRTTTTMTPSKTTETSTFRTIIANVITQGASDDLLKPEIYLIVYAVLLLALVTAFVTHIVCRSIMKRKHLHLHDEGAKPSTAFSRRRQSYWKHAFEHSV